MKRIAFVAALVLAGCATVTGEPMVENGPPASMGSAVALGQPVLLDPTPDHALVATAMAVLEDSRCPANARCVWAGRIVVETRIDGSGWRETVPVELGKDTQVRGERITLTSANPTPMTGETIAASAYRFQYDVNQELVSDS